MSERCMACGRGGVGGQGETNGLAIAGFICSAVGLFTAGAASPVGLVLSLIALTKSPRGFAVAGVLLGILGLGCLPILLVSGVLVPLLVLLGIAAAVSAVPQVQAMHDIAELQTAVLAYREHEGTLPSNLGELVPEYYKARELGDPRRDEELLIDPWKKPYAYESSLDGGTFRILSGGPDAKLGTKDDLTVTVEVPESAKDGAPKSEGVEADRPRRMF